jgi:hypothetical protein
VSGTPGKVSGTPGKVSGTSGKVSGTPGKVSGTSGKVSGTLGKVSGTPGKVSGKLKISAHVDGGLSGGSCVRRPGSEDPQRLELKFTMVSKPFVSLNDEPA